LVRVNFIPQIYVPERLVPMSAQATKVAINIAGSSIFVTIKVLSIDLHSCKIDINMCSLILFYFLVSTSVHCRKIRVKIFTPQWDRSQLHGYQSIGSQHRKADTGFNHINWCAPHKHWHQFHSVCLHPSDISNAGILRSPGKHGKNLFGPLAWKKEKENNLPDLIFSHIFFIIFYSRLIQLTSC